jgi:hypothetical protein
VSTAEELTEAFYAWELRGRGWQTYPYPVCLEPPFRPFPGHYPPRPAAIDDSRRETTLSGFIGRLLGKREEAPVEEEEPEPEPTPFTSDTPLREIRITLPAKAAGPAAVAESFLLATNSALYPLAFELVAAHGTLAVQFALRLPDSGRLVSQLRAFFPEAELREDAERLGETWRALRGEIALAEFGLAREFMLPLGALREFRIDPLLSLFGALSEAKEEEAGIFQVMFQPAASPWAESVMQAVTTDEGKPFFLDAPEMTSLAREKVSRPLFAVAVRAAAKSPDASRAWRLIQGMGGGLLSLAHANELLPLARDEDDLDLERDLLGRVSRRTGMLLGSQELASLVHLPQESVRLAKLSREVRRSKAPPLVALSEGVTLGWNVHEGERVEARLPRDLRMRHVHVLGASGSGKSTLLARMILEDLANGEGVAVLDPHGDLVDEILSRFPGEREPDLILFDPADEEVSLGWNMLEARTEIEKTLLASDLVGVFRRLSTAWGDQMNSVLANAILAFLESGEGGTLLDLRRFLVDRDFRAEFLRTVSDPEVLYYWQKEFPLLVGKPQGPILTRLDTFLRPKLVRRVVVERENRLDFRGIVDQGQVFLAKLAQGAIGEENAALLGSLLVSAFHQAAMSRQDLAPGARRHFFLYLDEFHELATPSMAALLTGARKYRLGLTLAHQELRQLEARNRDLAGAVLANPATRIVFRVGEEDARGLARGFPHFTEEDLGNLGVGEALVRMERSDQDFNLRTAPLPDLGSEEAGARRAELVALTRAKFPGRRDAAREEAPPPPAPEPRKEDRPPTPVPAAPAPPTPPTVVSPPPKRAPREDVPVPPLGRGGPEHQYLQDLVKRWAESHGYRATIEEEIPEGKGKVDVALRTDDFSLACEISVTSTVAQEVGNALKCLDAGFHEVAILALKRPRLQKIEAALKAKLPPSDLARVHLVSPEELFAMLSMRPVTKEKVVGGYKVRVRRTPVEPDEEAARYEALKDVIGKSLRRMGKKEKP